MLLRRAVGDPGALLAHVAEGIRERFPGFGTRVRLGGSAEEAVTELCNEVVETVSDDFVLVLDDVHLLPPAALDCLGLLVDHLPPNAHLALAGRAPLPFPLARLRALRVVEIGEDRLAFDLGETAELVRSLGMEPDDDTVAGLHHRTEGWAAGLILAAQSGDTSSAGLSAAQFDYLAEEILARQPPEVQEFLLDTSMLGRFSPELAAAVSGRADAADIARRLVRQHLFAVRLATEGEWYRYHHLLQAFLQGRLREREPERLRERHRRAATWWAAEGQPAEVVRHLLEAGEQEAAVDAIEPVAERMVLTSEGETLAGWLDAIPRPLWQDRPPIVLAQVGLLLHRARHEAAFAEAEEAIERLIDAGDHARAATAIVRLQQTMITAGTSPRRRWESGERYRDRIAPDAPMLPVVRILLATAYGYGCRFAEARDELAAALALPGAEGSEVHRGYAAAAGAFYVDFWTGRPLDALRSLEAAISDLEAIDPEDRLRFRLFARMLNAYLLLDLGRFEETLAFTEALREDFRRLGVEGLVVRAHNWIVWTALAGLGRWDELGAQFEAPRQDLAEETCYAYRYLSPGALLAAAAGECGRGGGAHRDGAPRDARVRGHVRRVVVPVRLRHGRARGGPHRARPPAGPGCARGGGRRSNRRWPHARAALVAAHVGEGDAGGDDHLARALALTGEHGLDDLWSGRERFAAPGLLARALAGGIGPPGVADRVLAGCGGQALGEVLRRIEDAEPAVRARVADLVGNVPDADIETVDRLLRDRDPSVREAARRSWMRLKARPRAAISIVSLGEFRVLRDGVAVPSAVFVRQKARALLACLVASGRTRAPRDALRVALAGAAARPGGGVPAERALRPAPRDRAGARGGEPALPDRRRGGDDPARALRARPLRRGRPRSSWRRPRPATSRSSASRSRESLYRGPFLADWPFEDWAAARRAELEELFKGVVERLAAALVDAGRPREAIPRYRRLLLLEPEREGWHRDLMRAYAAAGERALALRQFHACRTLLRREQGVEPDAETRALYAALLREEDAAEVL